MKVGTTDIQARARAVKDRVPMSSIVGIDVKLTKKGSEQEACCPFHGERTGSFMINDAKQFAQCFGCGWNGDVIKYLIERKSMTFIAALRMLEADAGISFDTPANRAEVEQRRIERQRSEEEAAKQKQESARGLWQFAAPMKDTPAQKYFEGRHIDFSKLGKLPGAIRYRHDCWNAELRRNIPAVVTAIIGIDGKHIATHRTFLEHTGKGWVKANLDTPKTILGGFKGAAMPIHKGSCTKTLRDIDAGTPVYVSEGIEDALTIAMVDPTRRVLAAGTLDKIGSLILPAQAGELVIVGQWDKRQPDKPRDAVAALEACIALQQEQADQQMTTDGEVRGVSILWPPHEYKDFNDVLRGVKMESAA